MSEVNRDFKAVDRYGATTEFTLREPTFLEENESEMQYRVAYTAALKNGVLPRDSMRKMMEEHEFWDEGDDENLKKIIREIAAKELELHSLETEGKTTECADVAKKIGELRMDMWKLFIVQQNPMSNSCEGYAEAVKQESLMAACTVVKSTSHRYWKNYKEYVAERDSNEKATVALKSREIQMLLLTEASMENIRALPEQKWVKSLADVDAGFEAAGEEIKERARKIVEKVAGEDGGQVEAKADSSKKSDNKPPKSSVAKNAPKTRRVSKKKTRSGSS